MFIGSYFTYFHLIMIMRNCQQKIQHIHTHIFNVVYVKISIDANSHCIAFYCKSKECVTDNMDLTLLKTS